MTIGFLTDDLNNQNFVRFFSHTPSDTYILSDEKSEHVCLGLFLVLMLRLIHSDDMCDCGSIQDMNHFLFRPNLITQCNDDDLIHVNESGVDVARHCELKKSYRICVL